MSYDELLRIYTEAGGSPEQGFMAVFNAGRAAALPPLDDDLVAILGRPNFACYPAAQVLRAAGSKIPRKAEHEQAAVLHYLLGFYLRHGPEWYQHATDDLQRLTGAATDIVCGASHG